MKRLLNKGEYNVAIEPSDWRYSAAIVGLVHYFDYHGVNYKADDDVLYYNYEDITENRYLDFVEYWYGEELHHVVIEDILSKEEISKEDIKLVNEKLSANTICKKIFGKLKFNRDNSKEILDFINENRNELIKETFRTKSNMYANYANGNQMLNESQEYCRLLGYYIDVSKKNKSISYKFSTNSFVGKDEREFDFIIFAFEGNRESFFVNNNLSIKGLLDSNNFIREKSKKNKTENKINDIREILFKGIIESSRFIENDVEIILKTKNKGYFETLFIRKNSIDILKKFQHKKIDYKVFCFSYKITDNYYINIQKEVTEAVLNDLLLDNLIELFLKNNEEGYLVLNLIKVNLEIRGYKPMEDKIKGAYKCAKRVSEKMEYNKLDNYKQKLINAVICKNYDRVYQILLQLSNYIGIEFIFIYDLFDNFENNKELVYTFINALSKRTGNLEENEEGIRGERNE